MVSWMFKYNQVFKNGSLRVVKAEGPDGQQSDMVQDQSADNRLTNLLLQILLNNKMLLMQLLFNIQSIMGGDQECPPKKVADRHDRRVGC